MNHNSIFKTRSYPSRLLNELLCNLFLLTYLASAFTLLGFYIPTTFMVISGWLLTCDSSHSWQLYSAAPLHHQYIAELTSLCHELPVGNDVIAMCLLCPLSQPCLGWRVGSHVRALHFHSRDNYFRDRHWAVTRELFVTGDRHHSFVCSFMR